MSNRKITWCLIAFYIAVSFFAGCIPEDSLQWSADGSTGVYSKNGALFIVDGNTGSLTQIAPKETTTNWPAISPGGSHFAYGKIVKVDDFNRSIDHLPPDQVKVIKANAEILKQKILIEGIKDSNFPFIGKPVTTDNGQKDSFNDQHIAWAQRYLVENIDKQLAEKIDPELIKKVKEKDLNFFQLVLAPTADPNDRKILTTSSQQLWRIRFSPDSKLIAWVIDNISGKTFEAGFDLYVATLSEKNPPVFVAPAIAIGYDFRQDGRAIAYLKPEKEEFDSDKFTIGSLVERILIDPNGKFLASPANCDSNDPNTTYHCTGQVVEPAGVCYNSWMFASYACDGRIFFSSTKMTLPSSKLDSEKDSVFCYDTLTGAVGDILPQTALDFSQGNSHLFALSHDSKKMLVPGKKNTLGLYALGADLEFSKILVDANEGFGDDAPPKLISQWKGPNLISCLVAENSHYLTADPNTPARRKEIVVLDPNGNLKQILSKDWPDELLNF